MPGILEWLGLTPSSASVLLVVVSLLSVWIISAFVEWLLALDLGCRDMGSVGGFLEDPNTLAKIPLPTVFAAHEKDLSIILPAYNEAMRLAGTLEDTLTYLENRTRVEKSFTYEVIVVDDGSRDETAAIGYQFSKSYGVDKVRVLRQIPNQGKGAAVRKGMLCARGALVLFADADSATRISDLEKLEEEVWKVVLKAKPLGSAQGQAGAAGVSQAADAQVLRQLHEAAEEVPVAAFGSRAHLEQQALASRKWYRNVLMYGFHVAVVLAAGTGIRDTQCGFKLFTRAAARQLFPNQRLKRWCFDVELMYLCKRMGIPMVEVAVTWTEVPGSTLRATSVLHMLLELAYVRVGYGLGIWPIRRSYSPS